MNFGASEEQRRKLNALSQQVIGCCLEVHRELGPGLLETVYEEALAVELLGEGIPFRRQHLLPVRYKDSLLPVTFRIDFLVEERLVLELKAVGELLSIHYAQVFTYLKLARLSLGLMINFNVPLLKDGVRRVVWGDLFRGTDG